MLDESPYREIGCQRFEHVVKKTIKFSNLETKIRMEQVFDDSAMSLAMELKHSAYGCQIAEVPYPKKITMSRWQHFKAALFPKLLLKWFPVKEKVEKGTIGVHQILPHIQIPRGSDKTKIYILAREVSKQEIKLGYIDVDVNLDAYGNTLTN